MHCHGHSGHVQPLSLKRWTYEDTQLIVIRCISDMELKIDAESIARRRSQIPTIDIWSDEMGQLSRHVHSAGPVGYLIGNSPGIGRPRRFRSLEPAEIIECIIRSKGDQPLIDRLSSAHEAIQIEVEYKNMMAVAVAIVHRTGAKSLRDYIHPSLRQFTMPRRISDGDDAVALKAHRFSPVFTRTCATPAVTVSGGRTPCVGLIQPDES